MTRTEKLNKIRDMIVAAGYKMNANSGDRAYRQCHVCWCIHFEVILRGEEWRVGWHFEPPADKQEETKHDRLITYKREMLLFWSDNKDELEIDPLWFNKRRKIDNYEGLSVHVTHYEDTHYSEIAASAVQLLEKYSKDLEYRLA